jgi:transposase
MSHGINDNIVHRWRQLAREGEVARPVASVATTFVPVTLPAPAKACAAGEVRVELRRAAITVAITWPSTALSELAAFTRELLR